MIHTKQPANQFYVFLTAYRSYEPQEVNEMHLKGMISTIRNFPGLYGVIEDQNVSGCFQEAGAESPSVERTLKVRARNEIEADNLAYLACQHYGQDAVLEVASQTHTATLVTCKFEGNDYRPVRKRDVIGTFTKQDTGAEHYSLIAGEKWEVC